MTALFTAPSVDEIIAKLGAQSTCDAGLTQDPWHFDTTTPSYGPGASMLDRLPANAPRQQVLPDEYRKASDEELQQRISDAKQRLGSKLLILGHFYQRDEIIKHADFVGDSFQLAKNATWPAASKVSMPSTSCSAACTSWPKPPTSSPRPNRA